MVTEARSDFNVPHAVNNVADALPDLKKNAQQLVEMSSNLRRLHELRQRCESLPEPERSERIAEITVLESEVIDPNSGSMVNRIADMTNSVTLAEKIAEGNRTAARDDAIALNATEIARVNARVAAMRMGRVADVAMEWFDPENKYDPAARAIIEAEVNANQATKEATQAVNNIPQETHEAIEQKNEKGRKSVVNKIAQSKTEEERNLWLKVQELGLMRLPAFKATLKQEGLTIEQLQAVVNQGIDARIDLEKKIVEPGQGNDGLRREAIAAFGTADGRDIDWNQVKSLISENGSREKMQKALNEYANSANPSELPEETRKWATLAKLQGLANANFIPQSVLAEHIKEMHRSQSPEKQARFEMLFDASISPKERENILLEESKSLGEPISPRDVKIYIQTINALGPKARDIVLSDDLTKFMEVKKSLQAEKVLGASGYASEEIATAVKTISDVPLLAGQLNEAVALYRQLPKESRDSFIKTRVDQLHAIASGGEYNAALSTMSYYNLQETAAGESLLKGIVRGTVSPAQAQQRVEEMQNQSIDRMEVYAHYVPYTLPADRMTTLRQAGIADASGNIDVRLLIETARINRDALGALTDEEMKAITNRPESELTPELLQRRIIAQTAAGFKAVDAIQVFAAEINAASTMIGSREQSAQLAADMQLYRRMVNSDGETTPADQRAALGEFLQRQQYLRTTPELRERIIDNIVELNQRSEVMRSADFASTTIGRDPFIHEEVASKPLAPVMVTNEVHHHTAQERRDMKREGAINEGDHTFQTKMEDRIQDVLNTMDAKQIVATFGALLGDYNVGHKDNITHHEIENMFTASGITDVAQLGSDRPALDAIVDGLRRSQASLAVSTPANGSEISSAAVYSAAPSSGPALSKA